MKVITPGHKYELANFERTNMPGQTLQFIQKDSSQAELPTILDGTTNEEVLSMLVDRLNFLNELMPCRENSLAITHVETALLWLNKRTEERRARGVEGTAKP